MILDVFDKNFKRIGNVKKFKIAQYTDPLNSVGSFMLSFGSNNDFKNSLTDAKYILFEKEVMGEIKMIDSNSDTSVDIVIKGELLKTILYKRCIPVTFSKQTNVVDYVRQLIKNEITEPINAKRKIEVLSLSSDERYVPVEGLPVKLLSDTGGEVGTAIEKKLETYSLGFDCVPIISNVNTLNELETNISTIEFRVLKGKDRSRFSTELIEGESVVEFSMDLKNLLSSHYIKTLMDYKNVAYVAGEGEGINRIVKESGDSELSGLDRIELYVDARDLQQEELSDSEYQNLLDVRGSEKLAEHKVSETFTAVVDAYSKKYKYGFDYFKGDWVSIKDNVLPIVVKVQITKVIKTLDSNGESLEITFGTEKMSVFKKIKRGEL